MQLRLQSPHPPAEAHSFEWSTPLSLFQALDAEFNFTIDVCASRDNCKCARFFDIEDDGLKQSWKGEVVWCNPPYARGLVTKWVKKAHQEARAGATVVMLLPNSTDSSWWHTYCLREEVRFLRGRLNFGGLDSTRRPRFGSAIVIFRPGKVTA